MGENMKALYVENFAMLVKKSNELGIQKSQIVGIYSTSNSQVVMIYYE